jgi:SCF-associated factor 1
MATQRAGIADIPVELLIDNILPFCEAKDVFSLGCTNKFFALITTDDMLWKRKLAVDYNFTGSETARTSGWKFIYQRLRNPRVFVWGYVIFSFSYVMGVFVRSLMPPIRRHPRVPDRSQLSREKDKGRLGLPRFPSTALSDVPFPVELRIPGVRVVSLAASGMSVQVPLLVSTEHSHI